MNRKTILATIALLVCFAPQSWGADGSVVASSGQTIYYNFHSATNTVSICAPGWDGYAPSWGGYAAPVGDLVIPPSIVVGGIARPVTEIEDYAFYMCTNITSVVIPNSVTTLGQRAFNSCTGMTSLSISSSVTTIPSNAFSGCPNLAAINIPPSVTHIGNSAFAGCTHATSVVIPNSVVSIDIAAFRYCSSLTSVNIPASVTYLGNNAFSNCTSLTTVVFNNSNIDTIPLRCFEDCSSLTTVVLPDSLKVVGQESFIRCSSLTSITLPSTLNRIQHFALGRSGLTSVTIPASVTVLEYLSFGYCEDLDTVTLLSPTPPVNGDAFHYTTPSIFNIPCGSSAAYASWVTNYGYTMQEMIPQFNLTVASSDTVKGSASIVLQDSLPIACDSTAILLATANYGYHFTQWSDGNTATLRTVTMTRDSSFTASFANNIYTLSVQSNNTAYGTVDGAGSYEYLQTANISATVTAPHCHFVRWSDNNRQAERELTVTRDLSLTAIFALDTHMVTLTAVPENGGNLVGGGRKPYGREVTIRAFAASGYHFVSWSNGSSDNPTTITVTSDTTLTATFEPDNNTQGINDATGSHISVYTINGQIVVDGAEGESVQVFDIMGRPVAPRTLPAGVYMVKVGHHPVHKVVIVR